MPSFSLPLRLNKGDVLFLRSQASVLATLNYTARFADLKMERQWDEPLADQATSSTRTVITQDTYVVPDDRYLVWLKVSDQLSTNVFRGTLYIEVYVGKGDAKPFYTLIGDYLSTEHYPQWPGDIVERGPGGGDGFVSWIALFTNRAGDAAALATALALTNTIRKVTAIVHYYNASADAATRTFQRGYLRLPGGTLPTGFASSDATITSDIAADVTLTASEEGMLYADAQGMVRNDNGTPTKESQATNPSPLPLLLVESDPTEYVTRTVTNGNANDTQSAYARIEEWLQI